MLHFTIFFSIPEAVNMNNCSWHWEDVSLDAINNFTIADVYGKNIRINEYVIDIPAFKFFHNQVTIKHFSLHTFVTPNQHSSYLCSDLSGGELIYYDIDLFQVVYEVIHLAYIDNKNLTTKIIEPRISQSQCY